MELGVLVILVGLCSYGVCYISGVMELWSLLYQWGYGVMGFRGYGVTNISELLHCPEHLMHNILRFTLRSDALECVRIVWCVGVCGVSECVWECVVCRSVCGSVKELLGTFFFTFASNRKFVP